MISAILSHPVTIVVIKMFVAVGIVLGAVPMLVWMERKVSARFQRRSGPNRVGPFGLLQSAADALKLMWKEDFFPRNTDRIIFLAGPLMTFLPGVIAFGLIPVGRAPGAAGILGQGGVLAVSYVQMGLLALMAVSSLASYGIAFGGWASNNQYSLLGGIRSAAQLISYEVVMMLSVLALVMTTGTFNLAEIAEGQQGNILPAWHIFTQPLTFLLFLIAAFAETNRAPFDLPEAEQELVGGYHTEYTGMRYAWFMLGEYAGLWAMCSILTTLFLGGWTLPAAWIGWLGGFHWALVALFGAGVFFAKVVALVFFFMWVRWTMPRFRWDQLMRLGWVVLIPLALANLLLTALLMEFGGLYVH
ncbi:MAG TPA: NADH-quinone oxidoreductase subunit NuoH [Fibrobacteria bacterium]|nr:NADH-quinone oxidoreductase subunit NuoH [Fibrobacteria bacterium]